MVVIGEIVLNKKYVEPTVDINIKELIVVDAFEGHEGEYFIKDIRNVDTSSWSLEDWAKVIVLKGEHEKCPLSVYEKKSVYTNAQENEIDVPGFSYKRVSDCDCDYYCYEYMLFEDEVLKIKEYYLKYIK